jgi:hypothetical protein
MKETKSQAHLADQLHWQDISQCLHLNPASPGHIVSSWTSPRNFLNDGICLGFDGEQDPGSLEGISEVLSAGGSLNLCNQLTSNSQQRRRVQNRASQRAYRERRDRHVKSLEERLEDMVSQQEVLYREHAKLRADHEKALEDAGLWKAKLTDVKEVMQSRATLTERDQQEEKELFVKILICRKECLNKEFPEGR